MIKNAIICKKCGSDNCTVTDTRNREIYGIGKTIYRRRKCNQCGYRWITVELYLSDAERKIKMEE